MARATDRGWETEAGDAPVEATNRSRAWIKALRLNFRPLSWTGYTLGALLAPDSVSMSVYLLGCLALFAIETATVLSNEYFDYTTDCANQNFSPFNGGSRVLVTGDLRGGDLLRAAAASVIVGLLLAAVAVAVSSGSAATLTVTIVLLFALTLGYTTPPLKLAYRGLGEPAVAAVHSIGVIVWGYLLQGGAIDSPLPWTTSMPLGLAVLAAILLAGIPDSAADRLAGKRTAAVRWGTRPAARLALLSIWLAATSAILLEAAHLLPALGLARYALLVHALLLSALIGRYLRRQGDSRRINTLLAASLTYGAWFGVVPLLVLALG